MKLPYGYVLVNGEIVVHEEKADVVRSIFGYYLAGPALEKLWTCSVRKASLPHRVIRNGAEQQWTNSYPMQNIFPLLVWRHIWMPSSSASVDAMWITTRLVIPGGQSDINLHLSK